MKIKSILAYEILDSRGNPTIEVRVQSESGIEARAGVPSGASTGIHEALELRDNDAKRFGGKGVLKACANANTIIAKAVIGMDVDKQKEIDKKMIELDGTENKSKLGANAILGVSLACARLAAKVQNLPLYKHIRITYQLTNLPTYQLPTPMFNIINGGKHADSGLDIQEFMLVPIGLTSFHEKLRAGSEIFHTLKKLLSKRGYTVSVGDEGGFAPKLKNSEEAFDVLIKAIEGAGYQPGKEISLAIDAAASEFFDKEKYLFEGKTLDSQQLIEIYQKWAKKYPIISIEDGLAEDDWSGWQKFNLQPILVGDDIFVTNIKRLQKAIDLNVANAILIKLNQIGTLSETIGCIKLAQENDYKVIISHRSGETIDDFIADLAVAVGAEFIKAGAPSRGERVAKYNRLLAIEYVQ